MKPHNLIIPSTEDDIRRVAIHDRIWYVPAVDPSIDEFSFPGWDHPLLFGNNNPIHVEYCSGNGDWIVEKAVQDPAVNWVAIEMKLKRVRKIWSKLKNRGINNLIILCGEGMNATRRYFPKQSISQVFVNFPDPWPKRRHAKNRLIQPDFVSEIEKIVLQSGEFTLVTDDANYSAQMIKTVLGHPAFSSCYPAPYFITDFENYGESWFENLWRDKGRTIHFHKFVKGAKGE